MYAEITQIEGALESLCARDLSLLHNSDKFEICLAEEINRNANWVKSVASHQRLAQNLQ
jgi:hypothetical protein